MAFPTEFKSKFIQLLKKNKISFANGWGNYMETVKNPASLVIEIENEQQLQTVIKAIKGMNSDRNPDNKITVRATAGWADKLENTCCLFPWDKVQEAKYNEGFSFSQVVGGRASPTTPGTDVIIRFGKKFHKMKVISPLKNPSYINPESPIHRLSAYLVELSAGVQITELADFLRKNKLSLTTASMIAWVTGVGLAGTAGHGTGRDEPAFSGLIESIKICDMDGNIRELKRGDPDFEDLIGGHSGLLGIVLSMQIRTVEAFNLCETIELFHNTKEMSGKLNEVLTNNQYISIMGMPSFASPETDKFISKWQIRKWNYSESKPTKKDEAPYAPDFTSFTQELEVRVGSSIMEFLLDSGLKHLLPYFMLFSAASVTSSRGTKPIVDFENHITHPQVSFPKEMRDVSYIIPVKDAQAGQTLETILQKIDELLESASQKGEYPVTYAIYVRYIKGTNGGLSTSSTSSEDERVLAIDIVTHPDAPGITHFEQQFMSFLKETGITPRNHLGKNFPSGVVRYDQFLDPKAIQNFKDALGRWYKSPGADDGFERLSMSPFFTPYLQSMLTPSPALKEELTIELESNNNSEKIKVPGREHTEEECTHFLTLLHAEISLMPAVGEEANVAKKAFLKACKLELDARNSKTKDSSISFS